MSALPDRLPRTDWGTRPDLAALCDQLGAPAGEARFVGGAVRDALLGIDARDVDIATVHRPEDVMKRVRKAGFKAVPTGIAHGTITAVLHGWPVEITTLRRDVATDGRRATVAFANDWREDAARRDFTMNALYADPTDGSLHDYFGGLDDLAARHVRFIGDPLARIDEDHLRILRYFRFVARFGTLDRASADYAACVARAPSLMALSRERIADELLRLLALPDPAEVLEAMVADGILHPVIPEIGPDGVAALRALIAAEHAADVAPEPLRRLAALLPRDPALADQMGGRLRLSNKARLRLRRALEPAEAANAQALAYRIGPQSAIDQLLLGFAFTARDVPALRAWTVPRLPLSGGDLIALGLQPGRQVAVTLQDLERQWIAAGFPPEAEARALAVQLVASALRSRQ